MLIHNIPPLLCYSRTYLEPVQRFFFQPGLFIQHHNSFGNILSIVFLITLTQDKDKFEFMKSSILIVE